MLKWLIPSIILLPSLLTAVQPAIATADSPKKARCTWTEYGKKPIVQNCDVVGNAGYTVFSYSIKWQDGVKTLFSCEVNGGCKSFYGGGKVEVSNKVVYRMSYPRTIVLKNSGVIEIDYVDKNYEILK
jgi:hypothetical protein